MDIEVGGDRERMQVGDYLDEGESIVEAFSIVEETDEGERITDISITSGGAVITIVKNDDGLRKIFDASVKSISLNRDDIVDSLYDLSIEYKNGEIISFTLVKNFDELTRLCRFISRWG